MGLVDGELHVPVALDARGGAAGLVYEVVAGRELVHALKHRRAVEAELEGQVLAQPLAAGAGGDQATGEQGLDLRGGGERVAVPGVVEGLDAQAVARAEDRARAAVPEHKAPHAVEAGHTLAAPLFVGVEDDLGVAVCAEDVAAGAKVGGEFLVVVDAAVEGDPDAAVLVGHRLAAALGVDDGQAIVPEHQPLRGALPETLAVGPAMEHRAEHRPQPVTIRQGAMNCRNPAHQELPFNTRWGGTRHCRQGQEKNHAATSRRAWGVGRNDGVEHEA